MLSGDWLTSKSAFRVVSSSNPDYRELGKLVAYFSIAMGIATLIAFGVLRIEIVPKNCSWVRVKCGDISFLIFFSETILSLK